MAGVFLVQVPVECGQMLVNGANAMLVYANDATDAKAICEARNPGTSKSMWSGATTTAIAAGADLEGWRLHVNILGVAGADITVTGAAAATVDSIGALAVTALNATAPIAHAAYNSSTNVLTIAGTADNLGDKTVVCEMLPPVTYGNPKIAVPSFVTTIVNAGSAGDALSAVLVQSTIPTIAAQLAVLA